MPASSGEYQDAFRDMVGHAGASHEWYGERVGGWGEWRDLFESTGVDFDSSAETIDAFENFLIAFYPQEGLSKDDWEYVRLEFQDMYGLNEFDEGFWDAWREAIGY